VRVLRMEAGDYSGEVGLLAMRTRTATVRAVGEVRVVSLDRTQFQALVDASEPTAAKLAPLAHASACLRGTQMTNRKGRKMTVSQNCLPNNQVVSN
jgi:CRP-like cAMP-binding protein